MRSATFSPASPATMLAFTTGRFAPRFARVSLDAPRSPRSHPPMTIGENATDFVGLQVADYAEGSRLAANRAWRIRVEYEAEKPWTDVFEGFLAAAGASDVRALVVGNWGDVSTGTDSSEVVRALVAARGRLPKLEAIFLGDVTFEE